MQHPNFIMVLYERGTELKYVGHRTVTKEVFAQLINEMFTTIEFMDLQWEMKERRHFKVETSAYVTYYVIIDAIIIGPAKPQ